MTIHRSTLLTCIAGLTLGLSSASLAQSDREMMAPRSQPGGAQSMDDSTKAVRTYTFASCDTLDGMDVVGPGGEGIGDVSNVIFDRLSGQIEALAVDLGVLSKTVSVPFSQFSWATPAGSAQKLALNMTEEQLKALPAFKKSDTSSYTSSYAVEHSTDPFLSEGKPSSTTLDGTVERVETMEQPNGEDYTVVTISDAGSNSRRVALGPNWYTRGASYVPFRGSAIHVTGYEVQRNGQPLFIATQVTDKGGRTAMYRDPQGKAVWLGKPGPAGDTYKQRYMLLSALDGRDIQAQGQSCGSIDDVIIERNSGRIAFLSIDPNENFLGIADTKRLVPFSLTVVPVDGPAQVDASKEMVVASIETPSDLSTFTSSDRLAAAYRAFGVEVPRYRSNFDRSSNRNATDDMYNADAWSRVGSTVSETSSASRVRINGTIESIETRNLGEGLGSVRVMRINADGKTYEVIAGPPAYLARQRGTLAQNDRVELSLVPMRVDAHEYWIARDYKTKDGNVELWDDKGRPAWQPRQ